MKHFVWILFGPMFGQMEPARSVCSIGFWSRRAHLKRPNKLDLRTIFVLDGGPFSLVIIFLKDGNRFARRFADGPSFRKTSYSFQYLSDQGQRGLI